jgi:hypothetical protein
MKILSKKLNRIVLSILLILIGLIILYINPESYVHRLLYFILIGCSVSVALHRGEKFSLRDIAKDKIYFILFALVTLSAVLILFLLYKDKNSLYTYLSLSLFVFSLIGLIIRNWQIKRKPNHKTSSRTP